ncbi:MAG: arylsulfatase [bacterium]|nr:MAG: arylsulfatase [bacterium]
MLEHITSRRHFLRSIGSLTALPFLYFTDCKKLQKTKKTNIIFILADDLGYGDLGCYGQENIQTPNIDKMAREGMLFSNFYAGNTICAPSRCSLMTGLHQGHAYIRGNKPVEPMGQVPIPADTKTVAKYLKEAGYKTGLIGKWGLGGPGSEGTPTKQGFDYFFGYLCQRHAHNYYPEFLFRNEKRIPIDGNVVANERTDGAGHATEKVQYSHDLFAHEALQFIEQNKNHPFFLYMALTIPHANNEAGDEGMEVPELGSYVNKNWPEAEKCKAAMISRMDKDVGKLLKKLKELEIAQNSLVFFTSDNGPHRESGVNPEFFKSSGELRGIKRDLYEGGIRVPMIAWWPGTIKAGITSDHVSAFWDFLPTTCDLAGTRKPIETDGISFLPVLVGKTQPEHEYLYWEFMHPKKGFLQAVRIGKWKAVRNGVNSSIELYDLEQDRGEKQNVSQNWPELIARVKSIFQEARTESFFEDWKMYSTYSIK